MSLTLVSTLTDTDFLAVFNRLCVALREPQDDSGLTQGVYFEALQDLTLEELRAGAEALQREPGRKFFPTTAEWRTAGRVALQDRARRETVPPVGHVWLVECHTCEDTGWVQDLTCAGGDGSGTSTCGRTKKHGAHGYTVACGCRATNRTYARHHASA